MTVDLEALEDLGALIAEAKPHGVVKSEIACNELTIYAQRDHILELVQFLRDDAACLFTTLIDICGADYPERRERFDVVYHFLSMRLNQRIRVKIETDEETPVPSVSGEFPCADWLEREAFDMYGILFSGHADLRRILTDYGFDGYPLRKDFPLSGHYQVRYDDVRKKVVREDVTLTQEYRNFDFLSPWEGMNELVPDNLAGDEKAEEKSE